MKDTVTGLELFAVHGRYGKYLQCDLCGTTLDAPRANVGTEKERIGCDAEALLRLAVNEGWECSDKGHVCSECLHQRSDEEISAFMNSLKPAEARKTCAARGFMFGNDEACWFYCVGGGCSSDEPCEHQLPAGQKGSD